MDLPIIRFARFPLIFILVSVLAGFFTHSGVATHNSLSGLGFVNKYSAYGIMSENQQGPVPYLFDNSVLSEGRINYPKQLSVNSTSNSATQSGIGQNNFQAWGKSNLTINQEDQKSLTVLSGSTLAESAGFTLKDLGLPVRYISVTLDSISKSRDSQLSFKFLLTHGSATYNVVLVNGPLSVSGWKDSTYFESLKPFSEKRIDLYEIFGSNETTINLSQIVIIVQKDTQLKAEFEINILSPQQYADGIHASTFVMYDALNFHNLGIVRTVAMKFDSPPSNATIVANGWQSVSIDRTGGPYGNTDEILSAEEPSNLPLQDALLKLDINHSAMNLGAKDWLLLTVIIVTSASIYPVKKAIGI